MPLKKGGGAYTTAELNEMNLSTLERRNVRICEFKAYVEETGDANPPQSPFRAKLCKWWPLGNWLKEQRAGLISKRTLATVTDALGTICHARKLDWTGVLEDQVAKLRAILAEYEGPKFLAAGGGHLAKKHSDFIYQALHRCIKTTSTEWLVLMASQSNRPGKSRAARYLRRVGGLAGAELAEREAAARKVMQTAETANSFGTEEAQLTCHGSSADPIAGRASGRDPQSDLHESGPRKVAELPPPKVRLAGVSCR